MQSFLQYRRFGKHVQKQYERDREKSAVTGQFAQDLSTSPSQSSADSSDSTPSAAPVDDGTRDLERGEAHNGAIINAEASAKAAREGVRHPGPEPMARTTTTRTQDSVGTNLGVTLTGIDVRDRTTHEGKGGRVFIVGYEGENDSMNPHNWGFGVRISATLLIASIGFIVGFASSIDSAALKQATKDFGVSEVTESLATGLFLIGFGCGALFAGPISETVGRNPVYIVTMSLYMIFIMASALSPNIGAQLAFRFIAGFFGSTPLTCAGGSISDLWSPMERVYAFPIFANAAFIGPVLGPVVGGFIGQSSRVSWRWTEWITLIISGLILSLIIFLQPETYAPILLKWKAAHLREVTGDDRYKAEVEVREETFLQRLKHALYRPFVLTFNEPIVILIALYLTVIYIILFTFLNGYSYIFAMTYNFSEGLVGLSFLGIAVGLCLCSLLVPIIYRWSKRDMQTIQAAGGDRLPPEFRLWFGMLGAPAIPISLFWMGWTSYPSISCWSPLAASVLFGYGILCVFISSYQYVIDAYESFAASALASVTLIRYVAAGGMVEVAIPMYENLGVHWTLTILGCLSALLAPLPYAFFKWGPAIRKRSKFAVDR
ncbi:MAG: hypothetical protein M1827_001257 [Pycnora praestabilis]|nr:MAG: hypothetical protein M1827_001257 [Pycnora praestabilis]